MVGALAGNFIGGEVDRVCLGIGEVMETKLYVVRWEDAVIGENPIHHAVVSAYNYEHAKALVIVQRPHAYNIECYQVERSAIPVVHALTLGE